ncbi:MAG TPA: serine/threonine protein kinase, partial [Anaeromyxobacter sp.]
FSVGALAWLALAGRPPFDADEPLEVVRRVLHAEAGSVRLHAPGVPLEVEGAIGALLEKRPRRRARPAELVGAIDAALAAAGSKGLGEEARPPTSTPRHSALSPAEPGGEGRGEAAPIPTAPPSPPRTPILAPLLRRHAPTFVRLARATASAARALPSAAGRAVRAATALPPLPRTALAVLPIFAVSLAMLPRTDAALAREVSGLLERGDPARARAVLEEAARRRPADPVVEKLRGDVACARGAPGECLRRYRVAIAAREELSADPALRANARRLLGRAQSCGTRRAAAQLLGELRDPQALPALEEARRSGGIFSFFCTGDAFDRAIAATRASAAR